MLSNEEINSMLDVENVRGYKTPKRFFCIEELVHPDIYVEYGEEKCWQLLDSRMLIMLVKLRLKLNIPLVINTYHKGGARHYSGLRPPLHPEHFKYDSTSQHVFGRAYDIISKDISAKDMRKHILENQDFYNYITYMEDGVNWLHIDCRNSTFDKIHLFKV